MKVQLARFEAPTMREALEKIRESLGDEGLILGTRTFRKGGVLGVGGQEVVEVFVSDTRSRVENVKRQTTSRSGADDERATFEKRRALAPARASKQSTRCAVARTASGADENGAEPRFTSTLNELRDGVKELLSRAPEQGGFTHPFLRECYDFLLLREVHPRVADNLVREIANLRLPPGYPDPERVSSILRQQIAKIFPPNPPLEDSKALRVIVLVGPTGVGKTTTIAKLAARAKINERRQVGLVTLDTYRIAAVDQLQKYAGIIDLPLEVVADPLELKTAIDQFREQKKELVFVDSAGRSHRDELKMAELKEFLAMVPEAEVHLVISCTTHPTTFDSVAKRFSPIGYERVILTKVDESVSMGALVASMLQMGKPVSFLTDGQNVPDDIMTGDPDRLAEFVLKSQSQ